MSNNIKFDQFRLFFSKQQYVAKKFCMFDFLDRFATGAFLWCFRLKFEERRLEKVLENYGDLSFQTKRQRDRCRRVELACCYSRTMDSKMEALIEERFSSLTERDIRILIVNRFIRKGGVYKVSMTKERLLQLLGYLFIALWLTALTFTSAVIWLSPASIFLKMLLIAGCTAALVPFLYSMVCYTIRPYFLLKTMES